MRRAVLLVLLAGCATTKSEGPASGPIIDAVRFEGTSALSDGDIQPRIATHASAGLPLFHTTRRLDESALALDLKRIPSIYKTRGFYEASVRPEVRQKDNGHVEVVFHVKEGQPTLVKSMLVAGIDHLPELTQANALNGAPLRIGEPLVESKYQGTRQQIMDRLLEAGYAAADVKARAEVAPGQGSADVIFDVAPGRVYHFGEIRVVGAQLVPERLIQDAVRLEVKPGRTYSPSALRAAQEEVYGLGPFSAVTAGAAKPEAHGPDELPVTMAVREANFLRLRFGVGAGIDNDLQQVRILADFSHLNVFGGMQRLDFINQLAYRWIPTVFRPATQGIAGNSTLQLTQPNLFGNRVDLSGSVLYERQLLEAFSAQQVGTRVALPWRIRSWLVVTPSYNLSYYFNVHNEAALPLESGIRVPALFGCTTPCLLSYLEQTLALNRRDNVLSPRRGYFMALGLQEGGGPLGGNFTWIRFVPEVRYYLPVAKETVLAMRLLFGYLRPLNVKNCPATPLPGFLANCSPVLVRFYGGGATGFRGYAADQLSPLLFSPQPGVPNQTVPIGGNSESLASVDLRWTFAEAWTATVFTDVGNVAATPAGAFAIKELQLAVGTGLRYETPVGPARLDLGFRPFNKTRVAYTQTGEQVVLHQTWLDRFAIFLSIGEAF